METYTNAKQSVWLKTKEELQRYDKYLIIDNYKAVIAFKSKNLKVGFIAHDQTEIGKKLVLENLVNLIKSGYLVEASGSVSWILRKKYNLSPLILQEDIEKTLGFKVLMNQEFDMLNKYSNVYSRKVNYNNDVILNVSLFTIKKKS